MQGENRDVILETTGDAVRLAKTLIRTARSGTLATIEPGTGWPLASRVGVSTDFDGTPVILISRLAAHTGALIADPRCSLLVGVAGKGDPLAHPRLSIACEAAALERGSDAHARLDGRYLRHQPKAALYAGLGDFNYFLLRPKGASLNAGFGRAYALAAGDLISAGPANGELALAEAGAVAHMNDDHAEAVGLYAEHFARAPAGAWTLTGVDAEGIDLADGDDVRRVWFERELGTVADMRQTLVQMAGEAREALNRPAGIAPAPG